MQDFADGKAIWRRNVVRVVVLGVQLVGRHEVEYDNLDFDATHDRLRATCERLGILWLERETLVIHGVRLLGTTLWTDFDALAEEQAKLEAIIAASGAGDGSDHLLEIAADALRLPAWDAIIGKLSGGEKRRVALCRLLLSKPDMLLLDEPTNHLDAESVDWLEQFLARFSGTVVAITHDRYFLDNAAEWMQRDYVIMRKLSLLFQVRVRLPVHETYLFVERYGPATYKAHGV